eukprot:4823893-Pyramimonas_sp.AAC.1
MVCMATASCAQQHRCTIIDVITSIVPVAPPPPPRPPNWEISLLSTEPLKLMLVITSIPHL